MCEVCVNKAHSRDVLNYPALSGTDEREGCPSVTRCWCIIVGPSDCRIFGKGQPRSEGVAPTCAGKAVASV